MPQARRSANHTSNRQYPYPIYRPEVAMTREPLTVLSLGAGTQSSTMLLMACQGELLPKPGHAIFADTQWEPDEVYEYLSYLKPIAEKAGIVMHAVTKGNIRSDALDRGAFATMPLYTESRGKGSASSLRRSCSRIYKIEPIRTLIRRELLGIAPRQRTPKGVCVDMWIGISTDEAGRMKDSPKAWIRNRWPLIEQGMSRRDCEKWLERNGYKKPPKSACIGCPYTDDRRWRDMKTNRPNEWRDAVEFDAAIRQLDRVDTDAFLHRSLVPLSEVDLSTEEDRGQLNFINECEGICGV